MNKYRVLLDMDGVLADFVHGACKFHSKENPYVTPEMYGRYDIADILGMTADEFWNPLDGDFWASLDPTPEAFDTLNMLLEFFPEDQICLLSSPTYHEECMEGKIRWVKQYFPSFSRRFLFGPVKEFCAHERNILIDDHDGNIEKFSKAGGLTTLFPRPWNKLHSRSDNPVVAVKRSIEMILPLDITLHRKHLSKTTYGEARPTEKENQ